MREVSLTCCIHCLDKLIRNFKIGGKVKTRVRSLNFRSVNFQLFKRPLEVSS